MKLHVKQMDGTTCCIDVEPDTTTAEVKATIEKNTQIPLRKQSLIVAGSAMEDSLTLADYFIGGDSTVYVIEREAATMEIFVKKGGGNLAPMKLSPQCTIEALKILIHEREGCPPDRQLLTYEEEILCEEHNLSHYDIKPGAIILFTIVSVSAAKK